MDSTIEGLGFRAVSPSSGEATGNEMGTPGASAGILRYTVWRFG